jgi:predicted GNAT family acetyltransferase
MTTYTATDAGDFLARTRNYLEEQEALNSLPLGLAMQLHAHSASLLHEPLFAVVYNGDAVVAAAIHTPPYNMVLACNTDDCREIVATLIHFLEEKNHPIPGIMSREPVSLTFAEYIREHAGRQFSPAMQMRLYELSSVEWPSRQPGFLRAATEADLDTMVEWAIAFQQEALPHEPVSSPRETLIKKIQREELFLWDNGAPVSMAARARATNSVITVNYVYTPRELRGHGYATACVAAFSEKLLAEGFRQCVLFTDLSNPTSNSIYQKIGYRPVGDFTHYHFEEKV